MGQVKNHKRKGARAERKTMAYLESMAFRCVRSAASLGPFDVVAIGTLGVLLVQVKANGYASAIELEAMREFPRPPGVVCQVHRWVDYSRLPIVTDV